MLQNILLPNPFPFMKINLIDHTMGQILVIIILHLTEINREIGVILLCINRPIIAVQNMGFHDPF